MRLDLRQSAQNTFAFCIYIYMIVFLSSSSPPRSFISLLSLRIPCPIFLLLLFISIFALPPYLPPSLFPLVVLCLVLESPHRVGGAAQIQVVELLVEHEAPLNELR